ncbi:TadE/TadG family type IV pilus assembly protein [Georgenia yuyongxinii]|uniref:Pilus assembly protein n=1 Tax=Georgenia yuyongxinii TaxID=2589797 RepID=A0A552WJL0_9MICO|nr:TadE family protein [Georgenia yuyongxinii]TRW42942.1 pilus assembly protein [Georgenia yuyongxinii]
MKRHRERGAAVVEFALVLPLLLLLVLGIVEFGRAYHLQTQLSGAAREAVREMALHNNADSARATARAYAVGLDLTNAQISVTPTTCLSSPSAPTATATVTVTYPMDFLTGLVGADFTLTGKGTMRCHG